jgi:hypothetical protein
MDRVSKKSRGILKRLRDDAQSSDSAEERVICTHKKQKEPEPQPLDVGQYINAKNFILSNKYTQRKASRVKQINLFCRQLNSDNQ